MGTTSPHGFPYPENTDLVTNGAAAIKALAEAVDDKIGAWMQVNVTVTGIPTSSAVMRYRVNGKTLEGAVRLRMSGASTTTIEVALPAGLTAETAEFSSGNHRVCGTANALDQGVGWAYGLTILASASKLSFVPLSSVATAAKWGTNSPFTWASTDELFAEFRLELA